MKNFRKILLSVAIPTCIALFAVALSAIGSTTIGTDITTGGDLTVTGTSTFTDQATFQDNCIAVDGIKYCGAQSNFPYGCQGTDYGQYYDLDDNTFCFCNGTSWEPIDAASAAACSGGEEV